jgi:hypothetical protein
MHKTSFATLGAIGGCSAKAAHPAATVVAHSAAHPAAPTAAHPAAHAAAPTATCKYGSKCAGCNVCGKKKAPAKAAGGGDGGVSAQLSAMQSQLSSMHTKVDDLTKQVATGFKDTQSMLTEQQQATLGIQEAMKALMMATAGFQTSVTGLLSGGGSAPRRELPTPSARLAICASGGSNVTEVIDKPHQYMHSCVASNEGGSASHSSQRPQSSAACGGSANSSEFVLYKQPQTELLRSSGGSSIVAARQLGVTQRLQNFEVNFSKMKLNDFNNFVGAAIRSFVANFAPSEQDEMACVLLGMVNGKKYPVHNSIIIHSNESIFRRFFGELAAKFPRNAVKTTNAWVSDQTFSRLSTDPSAMCTLISVLRGEE